MGGGIVSAFLSLQDEKFARFLDPFFSCVQQVLQRAAPLRPFLSHFKAAALPRNYWWEESRIRGILSGGYSFALVPSEEWLHAAPIPLSGHPAIRNVEQVVWENWQKSVEFVTITRNESSSSRPPSH